MAYLIRKDGPKCNDKLMYKSEYHIKDDFMFVKMSK